MIVNIEKDFMKWMQDMHTSSPKFSCLISSFFTFKNHHFNANGVYACNPNEVCKLSLETTKIHVQESCRHKCAGSENQHIEVVIIGCSIEIFICNVQI